MDDFNKPIHSHPVDPYEKIRVSEISEKKDNNKKVSYNQEKPLEEKNEKEGIFMLTVLSCLKKLASFFTFSEKKIKISNLSSLSQDFKKQLQKLEKEDLSESEEFLEKLSDSWKEFTKAYEYTFLKQEKSDPDIETLISKINNYFGNQEFTLGFYLLEYKKGGWHPFPFIHQLKLLHKEHNEIKSSRVFQKEITESEGAKKLSNLETWINLLDKII